MSKALLALFLTLSLATQVASASGQFDNPDLLAGRIHAPGHVRPYNTDFDDDQRGLKSFPVAVHDLPFAAQFFAVADAGEKTVDSRFAKFPLLKLHAVLLI